MLPLDSGVQHVQGSASICRSGSGLRPGYRKRRSRCGSNGSRRSHSSSGTIHGDVPTRAERDDYHVHAVDGWLAQDLTDHSGQPAPAPLPDRKPLDEHAAASVRAYAADQRAKTDLLVSVLEDIAAHGYPAPETGVLWEDARDAHLERLAGEQPRVA